VGAVPGLAAGAARRDRLTLVAATMMTATADPPRVLVVGTGALACLFGARLARSGAAQVTLAGTWPEALRALRTSGIRVRQDHDEIVSPVAVRHIDDEWEPADFALVLVKSHQTARVAQAVASALTPGGLALTLQNGLGNREILEAAVGPGRVAAGIVTLGATVIAPGHVVATPGSVALAANPAGIRKFGLLLAASDFIVSLEADLDRVVWRKLAVNCAINPVSALSGLPNGALLETRELRATVERAATEVGAVAAAKGIDLGDDPAELARRVAHETAANRSSMLQDLERGARTEIDAMNGALVKEARALGVEVPINERLWREVLAREGRRRAGSAVLEAL
jgi:2-dehydropantoate 2-reductase